MSYKTFLEKLHEYKLTYTCIYYNYQFDCLKLSISLEPLIELKLYDFLNNMITLSIKYIKEEKSYYKVVKFNNNKDSIFKDFIYTLSHILLLIDVDIYKDKIFQEWLNIFEENNLILKKEEDFKVLKFKEKKIN